MTRCCSFSLVFLLSSIFPCQYSAIMTNCCNRKIPKNGPPCISYDSTMMAETLDEAMFSFPNLASQDQATLFKPSGAPGDRGGGSTSDERTHQEMAGGSPVLPAGQMAASSVMASKVSIAAYGAGAPVDSSFNEECSTYACRSCKMSLLNGFLANPNIGAADNITMTAQRDALAMQLGTTQGSCNQNSRKRRFSEQYSKIDKNKQKKLVSKRYVVMSTTPNTINEFGNNQVNQDSSKEFINGYQTDSQMKPVLGVVTNLGCQYRRGEALESDSQWCGLCNLCWQWRKLPDDYYPNYLNEVNCDHNDDGCLSGFGECKPIMRPINVMRKKGEEWLKESIDTTTACECQVQMESSFHGLVVK